MISHQDTSPTTPSDMKLCMHLEQALAIAAVFAVGCCWGKLGSFPSETCVWFVSCTLPEIDLEVTSACELDLGFYLRSECKRWICFEDKKPLHLSVKDVQLECWEMTCGPFDSHMLQDAHKLIKDKHWLGKGFKAVLGRESHLCGSKARLVSD